MKQEFLGLQVLEEVTIPCGDCFAKLALVVVSETNEARMSRNLQPLQSKYKITNCYKCGGSSFETKVFSGSTSIASFSESFDLDEVDTDIDDGVIFSTLRVRKRKNG